MLRNEIEKREKNTKYYFIIDGKANVTINDETTELEKGDQIATQAMINLNMKRNTFYKLVKFMDIEKVYKYNKF